ncbi:hypothetical protein ABZW18_11840, partial [Streptomyces sp. NPDC004647]|uniref:hypothetical protein n=1 Tax=Streptomyces sp. NPDC004647 TaxID=3154671 RepID=UPI0033A45946
MSAIDHERPITQGRPTLNGRPPAAGPRAAAEHEHLVTSRRATEQVPPIVPKAGPTLCDRSCGGPPDQ